MSRRRSGRHPKVYLMGGIFRGGVLARRCHRIGDRRSARRSGRVPVLGRQRRCGWPRLACEDMADVLLTVLRVITSSSAMRWFGVPMASIPSTSRLRPVSGSTRPGTAGAALRPEPEAAPFPSNACTSRARPLSGTPWGRAGSAWAASSRPSRARPLGSAAGRS